MTGDVWKMSYEGPLSDRAGLVRACQAGRPPGWNYREPCVLSATVVFSRPKSHPKRNPPQHVTRPSITLLMRSLLDALQMAGVIKDDCVITSAVASKRYVDASHPVPGVQCTLLHPGGSDAATAPSAAVSPDRLAAVLDRVLAARAHAEASYADPARYELHHGGSGITTSANALEFITDGTPDRDGE